MTSTPASEPRVVEGSARVPPAVLTLWTDQPELARAADAAGVDRIGPDLERLGKRERQRDPAYWISPHREEALPALREAVTRGDLFARANPPHDAWDDEAERLIGAGVDVVMLPAFRSAEHVRAAFRAVRGRVRLVPLLETVEALAAVEQIAAIEELREVHFGLNDLALGFGLRNRFAVLRHPELERAAGVLAARGIRVGVGGIGRAHDDGLPIPSDLIYAQYARLGATGALIARSFFRGLPDRPGALAGAVTEAREQLAGWFQSDPARLDEAALELDRRLASMEAPL